VLDDHEVLASCHVGGRSLVDFLLEGAVVVDALCLPEEVVLPEDPDCHAFRWLALCNAPDVELVTLGDRGLGCDCSHERLPDDDGDGRVLGIGEVVLVTRSRNCIERVGACVDVQVGGLPLVLPGVVVEDVGSGECRDVAVNHGSPRFGEFSTLGGEVRTSDEHVDGVGL